ncbi:MAG TPA: hypothetical protein VKQ72_22400, partial [Aggregatilineales bacterium]|nr:hypothetical protein [Aggregatilineales bacterium]
MLAYPTSITNSKQFRIIGQGIRRKAQEQNVQVVKVTDFQALKARGIQATHEGRPVYVGGPRLLEML